MWFIRAVSTIHFAIPLLKIRERYNEVNSAAHITRNYRALPLFPVIALSISQRSERVDSAHVGGVTCSEKERYTFQFRHL
ncbi:protein of unknown function [Thauera humireducens]|nr:protein of unknown function [Thauera humireducens]